MFERTFKLKERNTDVKTELLAGLTTFMTMAYILAVNPQILGQTGMPSGGVLVATALASAIACFCMAFMANMPLALAPGMGLNAYFAVVVLQNGYSYQTALFAVFIEGIIFIILSLTNVREAIFNAIPLSLKHAVSAGIGLFIAFIGLQNGNLVETGPTLVQFTGFRDNIHTVGICAILCLIGVLIIAILYHKKVKGAILIGILATWVLGMIFQAINLYQPDAEAGFFSLYPTFSYGGHFREFGDLFGEAFNFKAMDFKNVGDFIAVLFAFLFVDIFDTLGTVIGVSTKANLLDEDGKLPAIKGVLMADAIGTTAGSILGTSTVTTFVESSAGVAEGGRTGLTALTAGVLFLLALILSPIFIAIPAFATGAALIFVGFMMLSSLLNVDFTDLTEAIPAYIAVLAMPFFYSIAEGISFGIIFYVLINLFTGKENRKKISVLMYILAALFILRYIFL